MQHLKSQIQQNIEMICALHKHPTHHLRLTSDKGAVVPIIQHESRSFPGIQRYFSADSRWRIMDAVARTIEFVNDIGISEFSGHCGVVDGLRALGSIYENDTTTQAKINTLIYEWVKLA